MPFPTIDSTVKGFLADDEAQALFDYGVQSASLGPLLEIGSYCGKSAIVLGNACKDTDNCLFAIDHHAGSEEHQIGEFFHDPELVDQDTQRFDSFKAFRKNIANAGVTEQVIPIVASSTIAAQQWATPLGMVFIDGGHSLDAALEDYRCWSGFIVRGGILAIHDVFPNPAKGGHAPFTINKLAEQSGLFEKLGLVNSLAIFRRV